MITSNEKSYQEFFKEELYDGFVQHLLSKYGAYKVIIVLNDDALVTKKGIHRNFIRDFNVFLSKNPSVYKRFANEGGKFMSLRNIAGGPLAFPIDVKNEGLMLREKVRIPQIIPADFKDIKRGGPLTKSAGAMKGQLIRTSGFKSKRYAVPKRLTIHFKRGYAQAIRKTTKSFQVNSRDEAMSIMLDMYEGKVAYAYIQNEEEFCFVKPKDGSKRKNRKLRG
jgi:hypothetical protein